MQARLIVNIFLLLISIALIYLFMQSDDQGSAEGSLLTSLAASEVDRISIHHKQRVIEMVKQGAHWRITQPIIIAANDFRVANLLKLLNTRSHSRYAIEGLPMQSFGLSQPQTRIRFNDTEIAFGIVNSLNNYRYVKTGEFMHLVDDLYYPLLSSQLGTLVSLNLIEPDETITKLELPDQSITRNENGMWQSDNTISSDAMVEIISNWKSKQAFAVHDYFERKAMGEVHVSIEGSEEPKRFVITDTDPWLILARPELGLEYHFNLDAINALLEPGASKQSPAQTPDARDTETIEVPADEFLNVINR